MVVMSSEESICILEFYLYFHLVSKLHFRCLLRIVTFFGKVLFD